MSIESAKAFLERLLNDDDFRDSLGCAGTNEKRMEFVKKAGFDFTKEEFEAFRNCEEDTVRASAHVHWSWLYSY